MSHLEIAKRSTRGSFVLFAGSFLSTLVSFFAIVLIARLLGPANYGVYTLCILVPNILLNFLGLGVGSGITRFAAYELARGDEDAARHLTASGSLFVLLFGAALTAVDFASAGFVSGTIFHRPEIAPLLRFSSSFVFAQAVFQSGVSALLGWSYMGKIAAVSIVQSALRFAIVAPLLLLGYEVYGALAAYFLSVLIAGVLAFFLLFMEVRRLRFSASAFFADVRALISYGLEIFLGMLAVNFSPQYVVALLAIVASNAYVGYYHSAWNYTTLITLTSGSVTQALFPAFAHLDGTGSDVRMAFRFAVKYMGFVTSPIIFLLMAGSLQFIRLPLGSSYSPSANLLVLLALSNIPVVLGSGVLPSFFNGLGRSRYYMAYTVTGFLVLLISAPLMAIVLGLGAIGLILGILFSNVVSLITGLYLAARFMGCRIDYRSSISVLITSAVAFMAAAGVSRLPEADIFLLPLEVLAFVGVYLTAAPVIRAVDSKDLKILEDAFSGLGRFNSVLRPILAYERLVIRGLKLEKAWDP